MRRAASIVILATILIAGGMVASFAMRLMDSDKKGDLPQTAVVFTGQFDRITLGLDLLSSGQVQRLFISGVNAGAGLSPETFSQQFKLTEALQAKLQSGDIILATDAQDTLENACETSRWISSNDGVKSVLLITSRFHMPRASLALARATDFSLPLQRLSVDDADSEGVTQLLTEFIKFSKTLLVSFLPEALWPDDRSGVCRNP
jgi:uncharacterized SAM-binding protein YcdF (DUF218 family)